MKKAARIVADMTNYHAKLDYKGMENYFRSLSHEEVDNLQTFAQELITVCKKLKGETI